MDYMREHAKSAGEFVKQRLKDAGVTLAALDKSGALEKAGGGLTVAWLKRLQAGKVASLSARQVIGLRRLFAVPIDNIIGIGYMIPKYAAEQAGIVRIARRIGHRYKRAIWRGLCEEGNCAPIIVSRIIKFAAWAVKEHAGNINTPAEDVQRHLIETFSLPVLIRFKWGLHTNIDDILGLGEYSAEAEYYATKDLKQDQEEEEPQEMTEEEKAAKKAKDAAMIAYFNRDKALDAEKAATEAHRKNNAVTISHFRPIGREEVL